MASSHLFRLGSISKQKLLIALKHNKREIQENRGAVTNIDTTKSRLNYALTDPNASAKCVELHAKVQVAKADIEKLRKNVVMGVEIVYSLPINRQTQDTQPFFKSCYEWTLKTFAGELLSFDVHLDESAPHAHAIILPLVNGAMKGSAMMGDRGNIKRLHNQFYIDVASHYGLSQSKGTRISSSTRKNLTGDVLNHLKNDTAINSCVWPCIRDAIAKDPVPWAQLLSIPMANQKKLKHIVDISRSRGRGIFKR